MDLEENDPYRLLGVPPTASERDIRRAYRVRVVTTHRSGVLGLVEQLDKLTRASGTSLQHLKGVPVRPPSAPSPRTCSATRPAPCTRLALAVLDGGLFAGRRALELAAAVVEAETAEAERVREGGA